MGGGVYSSNTNTCSGIIQFSVTSRLVGYLLNGKGRKSHGKERDLEVVDYIILTEYSKIKITVDNDLSVGNG